MDFPDRHRWDLDARQARDLQRSLAGSVDVRRPLAGPVRLVAAADVSFNMRRPTLYAAVVVVDAETSAVVETATAVSEAVFPYVPGLLSFRECPPVLDAFRKLQTRPDVVICDGQGYAHPRRFGLACHLGLWLGLPTFGCAKSRFCGEYDEPGPDRGDRSPLVDDGETIGTVLRTRSRVSPLFLSAGHLCDVEGAVRVTLASTPKYRLPVVGRLAHRAVNDLRRGAGAAPGP